ncbi:hypothetical protein PCANC_12390 [Puccinia coronata f. sp. avenae]|uniref:Uncharacterized protein n=2 Tax=Puccinia coronata f. sp. avenae TaxID=200324 RepID=A0A2N5UU31_9BASI|nr:hypothetical protein PCANC_12390 [Puccinia coronata f. sp. avenae]
MVLNQSQLNETNPIRLLLILHGKEEEDQNAYHVALSSSEPGHAYLKNFTKSFAMSKALNRKRKQLFPRDLSEDGTRTYSNLERPRDRWSGRLPSLNQGSDHIAGVQSQWAASLLLIVAGVFITRFGAGMDWESCEDGGHFCFDNWSGEEHQKLLQGIPHFIPPSSPSYHPQPTSPGHSSLEEVPNPGLSDRERVPADPGPPSCPHIDHPVLISNTPVHSFQPHPANSVADEDAAFKDSPSGSSLPDHLDAASSETRSPERHLEDRQRKIPKIGKPKQSLLDCIQMHEREEDIYRLVFDKDVFTWPSCDAKTFLERRGLIEGMIEKRAAEGHSDPPVLVIKGPDSALFADYFVANPASTDNPKAPRPAGAASAALIPFFRYTKHWMAVYERRLGIDFEASKVWITNTFRKPPANADLVFKMNQNFVAYIFFIDTIISILSHAGGVEIDRMQAFRSAVHCFDTVTRDMIQDTDFLGKIKSMGGLWKCKLKRLCYLANHVQFYFCLLSRRLEPKSRILFS